MEVPQYITQLSRSDMMAIAQAANIQPGVGVDVVRKGDHVEVSVNQSQLRRWMRAFYQNGGMSVALDKIDDVSLDLS